MNMHDECNFCGSTVGKEVLDSSADLYEIRCPKCGVYRADRLFLEDKDTFPVKEEDRHLFSGHLRRNSSQKFPIRVTLSLHKNIPEQVSQYKKYTWNRNSGNLDVPKRRGGKFTF